MTFEDLLAEWQSSKEAPGCMAWEAAEFEFGVSRRAMLRVRPTVEELRWRHWGWKGQELSDAEADELWLAFDDEWEQRIRALDEDETEGTEEVER